MRHIRPNAPQIVKLLENDLLIAYLVTPSVTQDYTVPTDQMAMNDEVDKRLTNPFSAQSEVEYQHSCKALRKTTKASARTVII
jgi:hypothetical protein